MFQVTGRYSVNRDMCYKNKRIFTPLMSSHSSAIPHCTTSAAACRLHLPDHPAQHQLHPGRRAHHQEGDWIPGQPVPVVRGARGEHGHIQAVAPGPGHGVPHQCAADSARGGRDRSPWTSSGEQDQVCRWAPGFQCCVTRHGVNVKHCRPQF